MKILVFSDSHDNVSNMSEIIKACREDTDLIIHLGDMCRDGEKIKSLFGDIPIIIIKGNNDFYEVNYESEATYNLSGISVFLTHGHRYGVKGGVSGLSVRARGLKADLVLFGHTHTPFREKRDKTLFFNPGSCFSSYGKVTFGVIRLNNSFIESAEVLTFDTATKKIDFLRNV